jgi:hypothetical protein
MTINYPTVQTKVVTASEFQLWNFNHADLKKYARDLGVPIGKTKLETIKNLMASHKATLCASLGN